MERAVSAAIAFYEGFDFHQLRGFGVQAASPEGLGLFLPALMPPGSLAWLRSNWPAAGTPE
jgi:hypothetical protein